MPLLALPFGAHCAGLGLAILIPLALLGAVEGYVVLPLMAQDALEQFGWLTASQMLDGLAQRKPHLIP